MPIILCQLFVVNFTSDDSYSMCAYPCLGQAQRDVADVVVLHVVTALQVLPHVPEKRKRKNSRGEEDQVRVR